jgi:cytochrome c oxidase subunit 2
MRFGLPHDASLDGFRIDRLIALGAAVQIPLLIVLAMWLLASAVLWGRRHAAVPGSSGAGGILRHRIPVALSLLALLLLAAEDAISWVQSNRDLDQHFWNFGGAEADPRTVRLEVDAHQWAWAARYAGPDGKFNTGDDALTLDDLRVPVETPILIELTSTDVIHDFYLPNFRLKQDVIPGRVTRVLFTAREKGEFELACSQHCGLNHYKMRGLLRVLSQDDYRRWLELASANSRALYDPADGAAHWGWDWAAERPQP